MDNDTVYEGNNSYHIKIKQKIQDQYYLFKLYKCSWSLSDNIILSIKSICSQG